MSLFPACAATLCAAGVLVAADDCGHTTTQPPRPRTGGTRLFRSAGNPGNDDPAYHDRSVRTIKAVCNGSNETEMIYSNTSLTPCDCPPGQGDM